MNAPLYEQRRGKGQGPGPRQIQDSVEVCSGSRQTSGNAPTWACSPRPVRPHGGLRPPASRPEFWRMRLHGACCGRSELFCRSAGCQPRAGPVCISPCAGLAARAPNRASATDTTWLVSSCPSELAAHDSDGAVAPRSLLLLFVVGLVLVHLYQDDPIDRERILTVRAWNVRRPFELQ